MAEILYPNLLSLLSHFMYVIIYVCQFITKLGSKDSDLRLISASYVEAYFDYFSPSIASECLFQDYIGWRLAVRAPRFPHLPNMRPMRPVNEHSTLVNQSTF